MPAAGKGVAPTCVVWAVKDPASANLDRVQVIKCWSQSGQSFEKVYDVAWAGDRKPDKWSGEVPAWRDAFGRADVFSDAMYPAYASYYFLPITVAAAAVTCSRSSDGRE
ncbi:MAG TPA: DUF3604 domain-containing protein [Steroidobacteraceae bacterium]|nr:DUF3604 domain-containing protein [Steroidobacteraceae bacterium]